MSVIIRLQNLPWSANSLDIRHYFRGLSIPEGGVHIVGGEMGDAFIAFSTDEDARQAMMLTGGKIKEVQISLMLSSRSEMQKIIEAARAASMSNSLAQLLVPPAMSLATLQQQQQQQQQPSQLPLKDPRAEKKDSSDLSSSSHETGSKRDRRDRSRSRSRDRGKKDRRDRDRDRERDRDRDRDRRRRSRSRSRSRDRRRRRSRSRSRGHTRDRERKDGKEDVRKDEVASPNAPVDSSMPSLLNPNTWMQPGALAQNAQLLTNFELLRNLANQKGPLLPNAPPLLPTPTTDKLDPKANFQNRQDSPGKDFDQNKPNARFNNFDDGNFQENMFRGDRFEGGRNQFVSNFPMRNGNEPLGNNRFGNFGRSDNGFLGRGPNRDRPNASRGLLDFPPQRDERGRQEKFSNKNDDRVDEFGRSIQLRNRKNAAQEEAFKEENNFQNQQNFSGFRFQQNQPQRPPPLMRGRDWPPGGGRNNDNFQERRGFRGSFEEQNRGGFRGQKSREPFGKFQEENEQSKSSENDCCVEIRNLSRLIAYGDVRRPFSNLKLIIKEIKFFDYSQNDKKCRIRFLNNENKRKAMLMSNKIVIDRKQVHLLHINDSDFEECVDEGVKRPDVKFSDDEDDLSISAKDAYVQVKDLAMTVEESDIAGLFPDTGIDKIILESDGKSKSAFIKFQNPVDAKVALGTPNRSIGDCIVFLTPLSQHVFNDHLNKVGKAGDGDPQPEVMEVDMSKDEDKDEDLTTCVLMKNLPLEANDRDICDFFSDIGLVPNKIHLMLDMAGQPSGDAFCEFSTPAQVERACGKNSAHLGKNIVNVCQVPRSEMLEALGVVQNTKNSSGSQSNSFGKPQCVLQLENIPFRAGPTEIINFFGWSYKLTENDILRRYNERGQPTGDAKVCFRTPEDALRALRFLNNRNLNGRAIRMKPL